MLQTHSLIPVKTLTDQFFSPFTLFPLPLPQSCFSQTSKPHKFVIRSSATDSETFPKSAIQRIADKLRSLGFSEEIPTQSRTPEPHRPSSPGEIFIPLPKQLPKYRVGHTIDSSWSTPENPVPEPGTGSAISRFHELKDEVEVEKLLERKKRRREESERVPTLAELSLPEEELGRLRKISFGLKKKINIGKAGITEGIVNTIHEQWRRSEVVKIACEDLCRLNMKRTHDLLERKTGGVVVWRSGGKVVLYRGPNYRYPYFFSDEVLGNDASHDALLNPQVDSQGHIGAESVSYSMNNVKSDGPNSTDKMANPTLIHGVGSPNRVRFQLPGELQLAEEADSMLEGLGPRFTDWWGYEPLPVDADLLPAIVPGYRRPFRLLPYGVKPKLTNDEMTTLRRLARPLPCHFALGRNRKLQGLAASIVKLWEKCEIAKVAVKRGVQNTNSEIMAAELQWLTGGTLLSRDREFIVLYRGKDFLPVAVSSAIVERRNHGILQAAGQRIGGSKSVRSVHGLKPETGQSGCKNELDGINSDKKVFLSQQRKLMSSEESVKRTSIKLSMAIEKKAEAEELLAELEKKEAPQQPEIDKEGLIAEERFMLRKIGLQMKPFLLLGRRGVFDGTVENMHLHWKYRELVKIISHDRSLESVHQVARTLEAESGGILVAVERVNKGYAIIVYRGKNYTRPSCLRPQTLLNKKEALKRSIEAQRRESLKLHVLKLTENIEGLKVKLDKDKAAINMQSADKSESLMVVDKHEEHSTSMNSVSCMDTPIRVTQNDELTDVSLTKDCDEPDREEPESSSDIVGKKTRTSVSMDKNTEAGAICSGSHPYRFLSKGVSQFSDLDARKHINWTERPKPSVKLREHESKVPLPLVVERRSTEMPARTVNLSNKERLLLRRQALKMKKRPVLAIGRSNVVTGLAKAIKAHFQKHPLAIVNVKSRAKGTSVQEVVFKLEQATGAILVSQEPSKVILYRGWGAEDAHGYSRKTNATGMQKEGETQPSVSPELLAAIRLECGLQ